MSEAEKKTQRKDLLKITPVRGVAGQLQVWK